MVSFDAVGDQDIDLLLTQPNFSELCRRGTLVREVSSVFVSNTYPTHTTIQTGVLPKTHGIVDNVFQAPSIKRDKWRFDVNHIRVKTLPGEAKRAGKTVCSVLFPVTGGSPDIRYNFVEIAGERPVFERIFFMLRYGSTGFVLSALLRFLHLMVTKDPAGLDRFTSAIACDAIKRKKPDLTMVHLLEADYEKHHFGPDSPQAKAAVKQLDIRLGELLESLDRAGLSDSTSILVFSDHNCRNVHTNVWPNDILKKYGLPFSAAYFHTAGGCCFLKLYDQQKKSEAAAFVEKFLSEPSVQRLLTPHEMQESGGDQEFDYGFAAADGFCFGEFERGQHGYPLDRDHYHTFYLAAGKNVPQGEVKTGGSLLNICPLAADLLEIEPWPMEGKNLVF